MMPQEFVILSEVTVCEANGNAVEEPALSEAEGTPSIWYDNECKQAPRPEIPSMPQVDESNKGASTPQELPLREVLTLLRMTGLSFLSCG
jgi:hypothetical protein